MHESLNENKIELSKRQRRLLGTFATSLTFQEAEVLSGRAARMIEQDNELLDTTRPQVTAWANPITQWSLRRERAALSAFTDQLAVPAVDLDAVAERAICYEINPHEGLPE